MGKCATGPDALARVLRGTLSKRSHVVRHTMRLFSEATSNRAFQSGVGTMGDGADLALTVLRDRVTRMVFINGLVN